MDTAASILFIITCDEVIPRVDLEMELNKKPGTQSFSDMHQSTYNAEIWSWTTYISFFSDDCSKSVGVIKYHLLFKVCKNGETKGMSFAAGFFKKSVRLRYTIGLLTFS